VLVTQPAENKKECLAVFFLSNFLWVIEKKWLLFYLEPVSETFAQGLCRHNLYNYAFKKWPGSVLCFHSGGRQNSGTDFCLSVLSVHDFIIISLNLLFID